LPQINFFLTLPHTMKKQPREVFKEWFEPNPNQKPKEKQTDNKQAPVSSPLQGHTPAKKSRAQKRKQRYDSYLKKNEIDQALKVGKLFNGSVRVNPYRQRMAYITLKEVSKDILIEGSRDQNRAFHGSDVLFAVYPPDRWTKENDDDVTLSGNVDQAQKKECEKESNEEEDKECKEVDSKELLESSQGQELLPKPLLSQPHGLQQTDSDSHGESEGSSEEEECSSGEEEGNEEEEGKESGREEESIQEEGGRRCWSCGVRGHLRRNCPDPSSSLQLCFSCSKPGHMKRDCPDLDKSTSVTNKEKTCYGCGSVGHILKDCPQQTTKPHTTSLDWSLYLSLPEIQHHLLLNPSLRPTGKIMGIKETHHLTEIVGYIKKEEVESSRNGFVFFIPLDRKLPRILVKLTSHLIESRSELYNNLFMAEITDWSIYSTHPKGRLITNLGAAGDVETEMKALLIGNAITWEDSFPQDILDCLPPHSEAWSIPQHEIDSRKDLREQRIFTIDPSTAKDMDDAISLEDLGGGMYSVGVHIADVTYFVHSDSAMDLEAQKRGTTVYLTHRSIPMLPRVLSDNLCSLVPGQDRLTFSVFCTVDINGNILHSPSFSKSIIRSCAKLDYDTAQEMIDDVFDLENANVQIVGEEDKEECKQESKEMVEEGEPKENTFTILVDGQSDHTLPQVAEDIKIFHKIATSLKSKRLEEGSLVLNQRKLSFRFDTAGEVLSYSTYQLKDSNSLIEEFMLLANRCVASKIFSTYPQGSLLRQHSPPPKKKMEGFLKFCEKIGVEVDASTSGSLNKSLEALRATLSEDMLRVVESMAMQPMTTAKYICTQEQYSMEDYRHYALAFDTYTHFTSPIRRYPDVIVHRTLLSAILNEPLDLSVDELTDICNNCNERKMRADHASDSCDMVFLCLFLLKHPNNQHDAIVVDISQKGFVVLVYEYDMDPKIYVNDIKGIKKSEYRKETGEIELSWEDGSESVISQFCHVSVRLVPNLQSKPIGVAVRLIPPSGPDSLLALYPGDRQLGLPPKAAELENNAELADSLKRFKEDDRQEEIEFTNLSTFERKVIYDTAEQLQLFHSTVPSSKNKTILVSKEKKNPSPKSGKRKKRRNSKRKNLEKKAQQTNAQSNSHQNDPKPKQKKRSRPKRGQPKKTQQNTTNKSQEL